MITKTYGLTRKQYPRLMEFLRAKSDLPKTGVAFVRSECNPYGPEVKIYHMNGATLVVREFRKDSPPYVSITTEEKNARRVKSRIEEVIGAQKWHLT